MLLFSVLEDIQCTEHWSHTWHGEQIVVVPESVDGLAYLPQPGLVVTLSKGFELAAGTPGVMIPRQVHKIPRPVLNHGKLGKGILR